jgi:hypothetical protein
LADIRQRPRILKDALVAPELIENFDDAASAGFEATVKSSMVFYFFGIIERLRAAGAEIVALAASNVETSNHHERARPGPESPFSLRRYCGFGHGFFPKIWHKDPPRTYVQRLFGPSKFALGLQGHFCKP